MSISFASPSNVTSAGGRKTSRDDENVLPVGALTAPLFRGALYGQMEHQASYGQRAGLLAVDTLAHPAPFVDGTANAPVTASGMSPGFVTGSLLSDALSELYDEVLELWETASVVDYGNGSQPSDEAYRDALRFVDTIDATHPAPRAYASGDGEVGFTWDKGTTFIQAAFDGSKSLEYVVCYRDAEQKITNMIADTIGYDRTDAFPRLPSQLQEGLDKLQRE